MARLVHLRVAGLAKLLGQASEPGEIPELLRHIADYYDDNPDACAQLFTGGSSTPAAIAPDGPTYLCDPFGGDYAGL